MRQRLHLLSLQALDLLGAIGDTLRNLLPELLLAVGAGCAVHGVWLIYPPIAWVLAGLLFAAAGYIVQKGR